VRNSLVTLLEVLFVWGMFSVLVLSTQPSRTGTSSNFVLSSRLGVLNHDSNFAQCIHVQVWRSWSEEGTVNTEVLGSIPSKTR